jgi:hypothetical protein
MTKQQFMLITPQSNRSGARHSGQLHQFPAARREVAWAIRYARERNFPIVKTQRGYDIGVDQFIRV